MSSQLDTLLQRDGAEGINHWGCKVDLSELELLIVPVNQPGVGTELEGGHWTVLVVRIREGLIQSFDSFGIAGDDPEEHPSAYILRRVAKYVSACVSD